MKNYKALLLTSDIRSYCQTLSGEKYLSRLDNKNLFVDRLRALTGGKIKSIAFIAASPRHVENNIEYAGFLKDSLNNEGFGVEDVRIIDCSYHGYLEDDILTADMVYLCRGHAPTQNQFFEAIGLKEIINKYTGIILAQGSGMINCSDKIYYQPRYTAEYSSFLCNEDGSMKVIKGLDLIKFNVMPHLNTSFIRKSCLINVYERSLYDSVRNPHFMIEDGGFIEVDQDKTIRVYGATKYFKNDKATEICRTGDVLVIPPKSKENIDTTEQKNI